jgi:hypothetical protein
VRDGATERAAKIESARPAGGSQATAESTPETTREMLGEGGELGGLEGVEPAKRFGEQRTTPTTKLDIRYAQGHSVSPSGSTQGW